MLNACYAQLIWFTSIINVWLNTEFALSSNIRSTYGQMIAFLFVVNHIS